MFCMECGAGIAEEAKFCAKCGTKVDIIAVSATVASDTSKNVPTKQVGPTRNLWKSPIVIVGGGFIGLLLLWGLYGALTGQGPNNPASNKSFLQTVLANKWALKQGVPCTLNGGAFVVYDRDYGKYFVIQGKAEKLPKKPIVKFTEIDATTIGITIQMYGSPEIERILGESNFIAGTQEIIIRKRSNNQIEESMTLTGIDLDAALRGQKRYTKEAPEISIQDMCKVQDSVPAQSATVPSPSVPAPSPQTAATVTAQPYDGSTPLECGTTVDCANQAEVVAKMGRRWQAYSAKTPYGKMCLEAITRVRNINQQIWNAGLAENQMNVCNMGVN